MENIVEVLKKAKELKELLDTDNIVDKMFYIDLIAFMQAKSNELLNK